MKKCSIEGCGGRCWARGLCGKHYAAEWRRSGPFTKVKLSCSIRGCGDGRYHAKGLCKIHYKRQWLLKQEPGYNLREREKCVLKYGSDYFSKRHNEWLLKQEPGYSSKRCKKWRLENPDKVKEYSSSPEQKEYARVYQILMRNHYNQLQNIRNSKKRGYWVSRID